MIEVPEKDKYDFVNLTFWDESNKNDEIDALKEKKRYFYEEFIAIVNSVGFAIPANVFQFFHLIKEDNEQITEKNILNFEIVPFLIQLLAMSSPDSIVLSTLHILNVFAYCSRKLLKQILINNVLNSLIDIFSFPNVEVQANIANLFVNLSDYERLPVEVILACANVFLQQSIQWAARVSYNSEEKPNYTSDINQKIMFVQKCAKKCIRFHYNIIVGSQKMLPIEALTHLSRFIIGVFISNNISLVSLAAWTLSAIIRNYNLSLDINDILIHLWPLIETKANIPMLRLAIEILNFSNPFPNNINLNWEVLLKNMVSPSHEISALCCKLIQLSIKGGVDIIEEAINYHILDIANIIYTDGSFKSMVHISHMLKNMLNKGNINQKKIVLLHPTFSKLLNFLELTDSSSFSNSDCVYSIIMALNEIINIDPTFKGLFLKNIPISTLASLFENSNDVIQLSKSLGDLLEKNCM